MTKKQKIFSGIGIAMFLTGFIFVWNVLRNPDFDFKWNHPLAYLIFIVYVVLTFYFLFGGMSRKE